MGRGLAEQVRSASLSCYKQYQKACRQKRHTLDDPVMISDVYHRFLCVATKEHWRYDSKFEHLVRSVRGLVKYLNDHPDILAVAVPVLGGGAGNRFGKLNRSDIVAMLLKELRHVKHANVYLCV